MGTPARPPQQLRHPPLSERAAGRPGVPGSGFGEQRIRGIGAVGAAAARPAAPADRGAELPGRHIWLRHRHTRTRHAQAPRPLPTSGPPAVLRPPGPTPSVLQMTMRSVCLERTRKACPHACRESGYAASLPGATITFAGWARKASIDQSLTSAWQCGHHTVVIGPSIGPTPWAGPGRSGASSYRRMTAESTSSTQWGGTMTVRSLGAEGDRYDLANLSRTGWDGAGVSWVGGRHALSS